MQDLLNTADHGRLDVDGCPIAWACWPGAAAARSEPPIVLVHGAGAHLGWWEAVIAPLIAAGHTVVAMELSGHGGSGHRAAYDAETWAGEVLSVIRDVAAGPALLAGHSMGGRVAICAAAAGPALVPRLVLIDAPVRRPSAGRPRVLPARPIRRRSHATLAAAVQTFRLRPREPVADASLLRRVAEGAFSEGPDGWSLRADLSVFSRIPDDLVADAIARYPRPITLVYGTHSAVVDAAGLAFLAEAHAGETEIVPVEGHHHLTLDQGGEVSAVIAERWTLL